jgi:hypothetical protein
MGFTDTAELFDSYNKFREMLESTGELPAEDWIRLLLSVEIVFASDVVGSGLDWSITTGYSDAESIAMLRTIQVKILRAVPPRVIRGAFIGD